MVDSPNPKKFPGASLENHRFSGWLSGVGFGLTGDLPLPPLQSSNAGMGPMGEDFFSLSLLRLSWAQCVSPTAVLTCLFSPSFGPVKKKTIV